MAANYAGNDERAKAFTDRTGIAALLKELSAAGIQFKDLHTSQSSLEDIFVSLVKDRT